MRPAACTDDGLRHYEVVSPEMCPYTQLEPPDPFVCFDIFLARSAKHAKRLAVRSDEFAEWVREARGDRVPPFKGLRVRLARCPHGNCYGCAEDPEDHPCGFACEACDADALAWDDDSLFGAPARPVDTVVVANGRL